MGFEIGTWAYLRVVVCVYMVKDQSGCVVFVSSVECRLGREDGRVSI